MSDTDSFCSVVSEYLDSTDIKTDYQKKLDNINGWVEEQRRSGNEKKIEEIGKALTSAVNAVEKFNTGDPYDITCGTLEIIGSVATVAAVVAGGPVGVGVAAFCSIAGAIVSANKPGKPSVVEQLSDVVHSELINFNKKLQDQELGGLQLRVQRQISQLKELGADEELDDRNLWNHFVHFMGQLSTRVDSPLPFKYENNLPKNPEMADFVTALKTYCRAHTCFMALLTVAKGKFEEFPGRSEDVETVDRLIKDQKQAAKEKLQFLSDKKHLTFLGRLPSEQGSLTKILLLSRDPKAKSVVEKIRSSLALPEMPDSEKVEEMAEKVSRQSVKLKYSKDFSWGVLAVQFFNETDFPMRIVSGTVGWPKGNLEFRQDIRPRSSYEHRISSFTGSFSIGGYMKIAYKGKLEEKEDPNEAGVGIIEFAMSRPFHNPWGDSGKNNIQDKTDIGRTRGQDTYDKMNSGETKTLYWKWRGKHYLATCENRKAAVDKVMVNAAKTWRFIVQDFDPFKEVEDDS